MAGSNGCGDMRHVGLAVAAAALYALSVPLSKLLMGNVEPGALAVAVLGGCSLPVIAPAILAMLLGFASYGLSILAYVWAQRGLGAARTSAYYAVGPFIGVVVAWVLFGDAPGVSFLAALALMALGSWLSLPERQQASNVVARLFRKLRRADRRG